MSDQEAPIGPEPDDREPDDRDAYLAGLDPERQRRTAVAGMALEIHVLIQRSFPWEWPVE